MSRALVDLESLYLLIHLQKALGDWYYDRILPAVKKGFFDRGNGYNASARRG